MQTDLFNIQQTLDDRFNQFDLENPQVYRQLEKMTLDLHKRGHKKIGIAMLFEVIRWKTMMTTTDPMYKLNNSYRSRYARMIMDNNPELEGFFELRRLHE